MTSKQIAKIHPRNELSSENPWGDDDFDRKSVGLMFENLLLNTPSPTTIALKADWGTGKTTFLRRVAKSIENETAVVFIDLWKADSATDPLAVIADELAKAVKEKRGFLASLPSSAKQLGTKMADNASFLIALTTGTASLLLGADSSTAAAIGSSSLKSATAAVKWASDLNKKKRKVINALSENLKALGKAVHANCQKPIIIVLDEFDRCRPDFAVQTLERIKHYFDTSGYTFVLAIDDSAVASAVSGHYGGKLDGEKYLRRFFDYEFRLPPPSKQNVALFAASRLVNQNDQPGVSANLKSFWKNSLVRLLNRNEDFSPDLKILAFSAIFAEAMALSVRDQLQATTLTFTLFRSMEKSNPMDPACLTFLCFARFGNLVQFRLFEEGSLDFQNLVRQFQGLNRVNSSIFDYFIEFGSALQLTSNEKGGRLNQLPNRSSEDEFKRWGCMNAQYFGYGGNDGEQYLRKHFFDLNRIA